MIRPAVREEDKVARIVARAQAGLYDNQPAMSFTALQSAVELASATGAAPCSYPDEYGRCAGRFHSPSCSSQVSTDWMAQEGGPPQSTFTASLSNWADGLELSNRTGTWVDDPDDPACPRTRSRPRPSSWRTRWPPTGVCSAMPRGPARRRGPAARTEHAGHRVRRDVQRGQLRRPGTAACDRLPRHQDLRERMGLCDERQGGAASRWHHVPLVRLGQGEQHLVRGALIDVDPGSALEVVLGCQNLRRWPAGS